MDTSSSIGYKQKRPKFGFEQSDVSSSPVELGHKISKGELPSPDRFENIVPGRHTTKVTRFIGELAYTGAKLIKKSRITYQDAGKASYGAVMEVRKGKCDFHDEPVAVKTINKAKIPHDRNDKQGALNYSLAIADMLFEIQVMSHKPLCDHRNIVPLYGIAFEEDYTYTPSSEGRPAFEIFQPILLVPWAHCDLSAYFSSGIAVSPERCAAIVSDVADGLEALHMYGIVHSDLKPANILLFLDPSVPGSDGLVAKLSDFGFSASEQHEVLSRGGSDGWRAPECDIDNDYCNASSRDVFSFGLVAMFVAMEGYWDSRIHGSSAPSVDIQRESIRTALTTRYSEEWSTHVHMLPRWMQLMSQTLMEHPPDRIKPRELGVVRKMLLRSDEFEESKAMLYRHVIPFTGTKGWDDQLFPELMRDKPSMTRAKEVFGSLPDVLKEHIKAQYSTFPALKFPLSDIKVGVEVVLLDIFTFAIPFNNRKVEFSRTMLQMLATEPFRGSIPACKKIWKEQLSSASSPSRVRENLSDDEPLLWKYVRIGDHDSVMGLLRHDPYELRTIYQRNTITHVIAQQSDNKLLTRVIREFPHVIHLQNPRGVTPLYRAIAMGSHECVRTCLAAGADINIAGNSGRTCLGMAYYQNIFTTVFLSCGLGYWFILYDRAYIAFAQKVAPDFPLNSPSHTYGLPSESQAMLDTLRHHIGPSEEVLRPAAGVKVLLEASACLLHCVLLIAVLCLWILILAFYKVEAHEDLLRRLESFTICIILLYLCQKMHEPDDFNAELLSLVGPLAPVSFLTMDFLIEHDILFTLFPLAVRVECDRFIKGVETLRTELHWIRCALDHCDGIVSSPPPILSPRNRAVLVGELGQIVVRYCAYQDTKGWRDKLTDNIF